MNSPIAEPVVVVSMISVVLLASGCGAVVKTAGFAARAAARSADDVARAVGRSGGDVAQAARRSTGEAGLAVGRWGDDFGRSMRAAAHDLDRRFAAEADYAARWSLRIEEESAANPARSSSGIGDAVDRALEIADVVPAEGRPPSPKPTPPPLRWSPGAALVDAALETR